MNRCSTLEMSPFYLAPSRFLLSNSLLSLSRTLTHAPSHRAMHAPHLGRTDCRPRFRKPTDKRASRSNTPNDTNQQTYSYVGRGSPPSITPAAAVRVCGRNSEGRNMIEAVTQ